ncbi:HAUS1 protein, partial [Ptilonorhynchus violaceus]|nr:HAUS1 protein [Ptilonorhynchus violaceus]
QVTLWLKKIYGDVPVPWYEVNERTVDILHEVMECNEESDRDASLVIEDMEDQVAKYEAEGDYWQDVLTEGLGLSVGSLSQETLMVLTDLVESALELDVKDTSLTSFFCAINNTTSELFELRSKNQEMERKLKTIRKKLTSAMMMENQLQEDVKKLEESQKVENAKSESRSKNLTFLRNKSEDMKIRIKDAEEKLIATGLDRSLTHDALMELSEEVTALHKKLEPLKKEVKAYHDLPP